MSVADDERVALRYAVTAVAGPHGPEFHRDAAYAGPHLLVVAGGIENLSSPASPSAIAVGRLRRLDVLAGAPDLPASMERGMDDLRGHFRDLLSFDQRWRWTGTALTAMLWRGCAAVIAHIGDTRAYLLRGGELTQLTRDHTVGGMLLAEGLTSADEVGSDPRHKLIARWLGGEPDEPAEIFTHEAAPGDRYLLCTAEIQDALSPGELRDVLRDTARGPQDVAGDITAAAFPVKSWGGLTCVVADVEHESGGSGQALPKLAGTAVTSGAPAGPALPRDLAVHRGRCPPLPRQVPGPQDFPHHRLHLIGEPPTATAAYLS